MPVLSGYSFNFNYIVDYDIIITDVEILIPAILIVINKYKTTAWMAAALRRSAVYRSSGNTRRRRTPVDGRPPGRALS